MTTGDGTAIISAVITGGALLYTMLTDLTTRKDVKDLTVVVSELAVANQIATEANKHLLEQNNLQKKYMAISVEPVFREYTYGVNNPNAFIFDLKNSGQTAMNVKVTEFVSEVSTLIPNIQFAIFKNEPLRLEGTRDITKDFSFSFTLTFADIYGNSYRQTHKYIANQFVSSPAKITYA